MSRVESRACTRINVKGREACRVIRVGSLFHSFALKNVRVEYEYIEYEYCMAADTKRARHVEAPGAFVVHMPFTWKCDLSQILVVVHGKLFFRTVIHFTRIW